MELLTTSEISKQWGISSRRVAVLCEENRIEGAVKKGKTWLIPSDAAKPLDGRYKRASSYTDRFAELEKNFPVIYPENPNATYASLLNYSDDLDKAFQRWYRYKEGFSVELVEHLIREYSVRKKGVILDPFAGSGSTLLAAGSMGYSGIGFEVNPFSCFLSKCKLDNYSRQQAEEFRRRYESILDRASEEREDYVLPGLSISGKVFSKEIEQYYMTIKAMINREAAEDGKIRDLLMLGWLACLEPLCNYRKAGNGLKYRKYVRPRIVTCEDARIMLLEEYHNIYIDLLKRKNRNDTVLYNETCLNMRGVIPDHSIEGIIFSPPYANCFDYTEIYKLELWFGGFVNDYKDLKKLRNASVHSHLNADMSMDAEPDSEILLELLGELEKRELWDKKIPKMLKLYYNEMFQVLDECCRVLQHKGFCCIVVGNSAYGGIVFPADLILAEYGARIGFAVDKIEVDRYIITSSQQYDMTRDSGNYLRESVVCLVKNR